MVAVGFNPRTPATPKIHSVAERRLNRVGVIAPLTDSCVALRRGWFLAPCYPWVETHGYHHSVAPRPRQRHHDHFATLWKSVVTFQVSGETRSPANGLEAPVP